MTLAAALSAMSDEQLAFLLGARPDLARPAPASFGDLAARAASVHSVQRAIDQLDLFAYQVLNVACLLPDGTPIARLADLLSTGGPSGPAKGGPAPLADVQAAVDRLAAMALVVPQRPGVSLPGMTRQVLVYAAQLGRPLAVLAGTVTQRELDRACRALGRDPGGTQARKLGRIAAAVSDEEFVLATLAQAPADVQELIPRLARAPRCRLPHGYWYYGRGPAPSWIDWMIERALVVPVEYGDAELPREIGLTLRGGFAYNQASPRRPEPSTAAVDQTIVDKEAAAQAETLVRALTAVLTAWAESPAAELKSGGLGTRELKRAAKLSGLTEAEVTGVLEAGLAAGLLARAAGSAALVYAPTAAFDAWLSQSIAERWVALCEGWRRVPIDPTLADPEFDGPKRTGALAQVAFNDAAALRRRATLLDTLARVAPGARPDPLAVFSAARWVAPAAWLASSASAAMAMIEELELFGVLAQGALSTAGRRLVEGDQPGAAAAAAPLLPVLASTFTLQADFTCVAPAALVAPVALELDLLADVESKGAATVYRITEASLRRAYDAGRTAEGVHAFLADHATRGVPQPLQYLVADSFRRHGTVRAGAVQSYVRSDDPALVSQVLRMKRSGPLHLRQLAPGVIVSGAPVARLLEVLRANGFSPVEEDGAGGAVLAGRPRHRAPAAARLAGQAAVERVATDVGAVIGALRKAGKAGKAGKA